jgi:hypothetical protein
MSNTKEFVLKDKISYIYDGYEKFYFVDAAENMYDLDKMVVKNVYLWKISKPGDNITLALNGQRYNVDKIN